MKRTYFLLVITMLFVVSLHSDAQVNSAYRDQRAITTSVPFLMISPDARAGAMGDAGAALPNDLNAIHWNSAKMPFIDKNGAMSLSYTPWLRQLVPDVNLAYLSGYGKLNSRQAVGGSLRYFSLGEIQFTDNVGNSLGNYTPNELAIDGAFAQKLSDHFSVGLAFRYIYSNLGGGAQLTQTALKPGVSYAADISCYYKNDTKYKGYKVNYGFGLAATNIGAKVTYSTAQFENFIPINLRLGGYGQIEIDKYNTLALLLDLNKLMVPSNPVYKLDANGRPIVDKNNPGHYIIDKGMDPNVPVIQGMFQSFYDAPGGISEELQEINISTGIEYWYDKQFALRGGYFHENQFKGNRRYMTLGLGLKYNVFGLDVAYLVSFGQRNPLDNTLRFTLSFDFDAFKSQKNTEGQDGSGGTFSAPKD
jgi:hypothetical protein